MKPLLKKKLTQRAKPAKHRIGSKTEILQIRIDSVLLEQIQLCADKNNLTVADWGRNVLEAHCLLSHIRGSKNAR